MQTAKAETQDLTTLQAIADQARAMIRTKGRYNTEQATIKLAALLGVDLKAYEPAPVSDGWRDAATVKPHKLEEVICKLESGLNRVGRWNPNQGGYFQFAEFLHPEHNGRNKYPPVESEANKVVQWHPISLYASPAQPVAVPDAIEPQEWFESSEQQLAETSYCAGWNDCRKAMLAATPSPAAEGAKVAQPAEVLSDDLSAFSAWKNYPLPQINGEGRFDADWLNREFVAFKAGRSRAVLAQPSGGDAPEEIEARRPTDMSVRLRKTADKHPGWKPLLDAAADEIERYYTGMQAWKATAEAKDRESAALAQQGQDAEDAKRYRWLRTNYPGFTHDMLTGELPESPAEIDDSWRPELDQRIDAAIAASTKGGEA